MAQAPRPEASQDVNRPGLEAAPRETADHCLALDAGGSSASPGMNAQAELIRKQRELDDAKREMELTVEKRVEESLGGVRHKAKQEAEDAFKLKLLEKEQLIASMQRQVEELKRKSEQGSQQLQGGMLRVHGIVLNSQALINSRLARNPQDSTSMDSEGNWD